MAWDYFHEIIWRERCVKIVEWEQKEGIQRTHKRNWQGKKAPLSRSTVERKRRKRDSSSRHAGNSADGNERNIEELKRRRIEQKQESYNLCMSTIGDRILFGGKPFWCGT